MQEKVYDFTYLIHALENNSNQWADGNEFHKQFTRR